MRRRVFLYGTLVDAGLLDIVAGLQPGREAWLDDHRVRAVAGGRYPEIVAAPGARAPGRLVIADAGALSRLDFYETGFGYVRRRVEVTTAGGERLAAECYFPDAPRGEGDWSLERWQRDHAALAREAAREFMALAERLDATEAAARYPGILSRAAARLRARREPSPEAYPAPGDAVLEESALPYARIFAIQEDRLRFPTFAGGLSAPVTRASFVTGDAVTVLPYDPAGDRVLVLRQFRHGPFVRGDPNPWTLEPVAGRIDPGEDAEQAARRELAEEARIAAREMLRIGGYYPTPGAMAEHVTSYVALCDLGGVDGRIGGLDEESEDLMAHVMQFGALVEALGDGRVNTGTLMISALWLARERAALRR